MDTNWIEKREKGTTAGPAAYPHKKRNAGLIKHSRTPLMEIVNFIGAISGRKMSVKTHTVTLSFVFGHKIREK